MLLVPARVDAVGGLATVFVHSDIALVVVDALDEPAKRAPGIPGAWTRAFGLAPNRVVTLSPEIVRQCVSPSLRRTHFSTRANAPSIRGR